MKTFVAAALAMAAALPMAAPAAPIVQGEQRYTEAQLDRLLAPIALYPDTVLTHVLIAATYPLEVVMAARWSQEHPDLRGQAAVDAVEAQDWDASVKALVAFPELLERMSADLSWTEDLGNAFLAQESLVMDRVQVLRDRADAAGTLDDVEEVRVVREAEVIHIEPVREVVYVPYYDTRVVYGSWWWPAHPPVYWAYWGGHPWHWYHTHYHATHFWWGVGWYRPHAWFWYSAPHWHERRVVTVNHYHRHSHHYYGSSRHVARHHHARHWQHNPRHRHNVSYRNERVAREHNGAWRGRSHRDSDTHRDSHRDGGDRRESRGEPQRRERGEYPRSSREIRREARHEQLIQNLRERRDAPRRETPRGETPRRERESSPTQVARDSRPTRAVRESSSPLPGGAWREAPPRASAPRESRAHELRARVIERAATSASRAPEARQGRAQRAEGLVPRALSRNESRGEARSESRREGREQRKGREQGA
jgi:hypothetical protein